MTRVVKDYEYGVTGKFSKPLKLNEVKSAYEALLKLDFLDGFSQIDSSPIAPKESRVTLSSSDSTLSVEFDRQVIAITYTNQLKGPQFDFRKTWAELKAVLVGIDRELPILSRLEEIRYLHTKFLLAPEDESSAIRAKIFSNSVSEGLNGFSLNLAYHVEDDNFSGSHYHNLIRIVVGTPSAVESEDFLQLLNDFDPYFFTTQAVLDEHDNHALDREEVLVFLAARMNENLAGKYSFLDLLREKPNGKTEQK